MSDRLTISQNERGFTLLEVILALSILLTLSVATTGLLRGTIEMRGTLSQQAETTHRLSMVMQKVTQDLEHAFIISTLRQEYNYVGRATKTVFRISLKGDNSELALTTMTRQPRMANAGESDQTYVVYRIEEDRDAPGHYNLLRGESKVLPDSFKDDPPMEILAKDIKAFRVIPWNGDRWEKDQWDTDRSDWRNTLPQMVKVEIEAVDEDPAGQDNMEKALTAQVGTVVYLAQAFGMKEIKERSRTIKYF